MFTLHHVPQYNDTTRALMVEMGEARAIIGAIYRVDAPAWMVLTGEYACSHWQVEVFGHRIMDGDTQARKFACFEDVLAWVDDNFHLDILSYLAGDDE